MKIIPAHYTDEMLFLKGGFFALIVLAVVDLSAATCKHSFRGRDALDNAPLIDGNNGLPYNIYRKLSDNLTDFRFDSNLTNDSSWGNAACPTCYTDLPRMFDGKIGGQFWVVNTDCVDGYNSSVMPTLLQINVIRRLTEKYPNKLQLVTNAADIEPVWRSGKIASMIAIEGCHSLGSNVAMLRIYHELGVRYITLIQTCKEAWSHVSPAAKWNSYPILTDSGKAIVLEMNRLGIMVDLTHSVPDLVRTVLNVTRAPIIFSHSAAFAICNDTQNVPDDVLLSIKKNNGIVMVSFSDVYVNCNKTRKATIEDVVDHINYIRKLIGVDHVGIGGHYDGTSTVPRGLEDVSKYPALFDCLHDNRENEPIWSPEDLEKLAGRNLIRVFLAVEAVRDCLAFEPPWQSIANEQLDIAKEKATQRLHECQSANKREDVKGRDSVSTPSTRSAASTFTEIVLTYRIYNNQTGALV